MGEHAVHSEPEYGSEAPHGDPDRSRSATDDSEEPAELSAAVGALVFNFVWRALGETGVAKLFARTEIHNAKFLLSGPTRWVSYRRVKDIAAAAADMCNEPDFGWRIGEELGRFLNEHGIIAGLRAVPLATALHLVVQGVNDEVSVRSLTITSLDGGEATIECTSDPVAADRFLCRVMSGLFTTVPLFIGATGTVVESRCVSDGAPSCVFHVRWKPAGIDPTGSLSGLSSPETSRTRHIEPMYEWALELIESGNPLRTLERVVNGLTLPTHITGVRATINLTSNGETSSYGRGSLAIDVHTQDTSISSIMTVPIARADRDLGTLEVAVADGNGLSLDDREFVETCARQIGTAVEAVLVFNHLRERATLDPLTGLANRAHLEQLASEFFAMRQESRRLGIVFVDLDGFKGINDRLGHAAGDELLRQVGTRLASSVRGTDVVARYGGDEFVVLVPDASAPDAIQGVARKLAALFDKPFRLGPERVHLNASFGTARAPEDGKTFAELLERADRRMYAAKGACSQRAPAPR